MRIKDWYRRDGFRGNMYEGDIEFLDRLTESVIRSEGGSDIGFIHRRQLIMRESMQMVKMLVGMATDGVIRLGEE